MDLTLSKDAQKFIAKLEEKQARQIALRIMDLKNFGHLHDSKKLKGSEIDYYRVDAGEFRIIYQIEEETILILLVGKRNDNEVYNQFKRKIKN